MKNTSIYIQIALIILICVLVVLTIAFSSAFDSNPKSASTFVDDSEIGLKHNVDDANCFCINPEGDFIIGSTNSITAISPTGEHKYSIKMEQPVTALFAAQEGLYAASGSTVYLIRNDNAQKVFTDLGSTSIVKSIRKVGDTVYISDAGNKLLYKYSDTGKLTHIYSFETAPTLMIVSSWFDFVVMPDASFWITNPGNHQMDLYSKDGKYIKSIPESEDTVLFEGCCNPLLLEQIAENKIITWEKGVKRVRVIDVSGNVLDEIYVDSHFQTELNVLDMTYKNGVLYLLDSQKIYTLKVTQ